MPDASNTHFVRGERGVSEILGTVLVFSVVLLMATVLTGVGFALFDGTAQQFDDRVGQDTMVEIDDRLSGISGSTLDTGTELEIPHGVGDQIEAMPEEGEVRINVTTQETGSVTESDIVADEMSNETSFTLGTLVHETSGGVQTVYQGGLLFERHGAHHQILAEPGFDFDGERLDFGLTDVSDIDRLNNNDERFVHQDRESSLALSVEIEQMVAEHRTIVNDDGEMVGVAPITVVVTVETDHPEAWETYATERMTAGEQIGDEDDESAVVSVGDDYVEFEFSFAGPLASEDDVPAEEAQFNERVLASGSVGGVIAAHNGSLGEINEISDGFSVTDSGQTGAAQSFMDVYGLAVTEGDKEDWKVYDSPDNEGQQSSGSWMYLNGTEAEEPDAVSEDPSAQSGTDEDNWRWDDEETQVCLVVPDDSPGQSGSGDVLDLVEEGCDETTTEDAYGSGPVNSDINVIATD